MSDFIAKAPVQRIMRSVGAYLISDAAVEMMISHLEQFATELTKKAIEIASKENHKTVTVEDLAAAMHP
jgi:histone H3/H4